jgi:L-fuculose-phosphate aldolase
MQLRKGEEPQMATQEIYAPIGDALGAELDKAARACRILEMEGHGSRTLGHLSLRDPEGRGFWLKRWGITFGEVFDRRDFVLLDIDGHKIGGEGRRHSEWPIHAEIFRRRDDVMSVVHSHPVYCRMFSAVDEPLRAVANSGAHFPVSPPRFTTTSELIRTVDVAAEMAEMLGDHNTVLLRNHGVVFCGGSIEEVVTVGAYIEEACREHIMIAASGLKWEWPSDAELAAKHGGVKGTGGWKRNFDYFLRRLKAIETHGDPAFPTEPVPID